MNLRLMSRRTVIAAAALVCAGLAPLSAHHAFGLFDLTRATEIEGRVSRYEWSNPHCWLFVTVRAADGTEQDYGFELSSVGEMVRRGWNRASVKSGDVVKVQFSPMRDGRPAGLLMSAWRVDGQQIGSVIRRPMNAAGPASSANPASGANPANGADSR